jgi:hypothetical protein
MLNTSISTLQRLRPVSFHLKSDPKGALQYGLIAEEVAKVYPELVIRDDKGRIDGVRYDELAPMLLSELQRQQQKLAAEDQRAASQDATRFIGTPVNAGVSVMGGRHRQLAGREN